MITNRTQADVDSIDKDSTQVSKGAYNHTDLNRVELKVKELNEELKQYGYMTETLLVYWVWKMTDKFNTNNSTRYLGNIRKIREALPVLPTTPTVPVTMNYLTYEKANNIEKILVDVEMLLFSMKNYFVYSGIANAGQPRVYQNRFRHRLMNIWTDLTQTYWTDFSNTERWEDIIYANNY